MTATPEPQQPDERNPKTCPVCNQWCVYDGWDHVHRGGLGIGSCLNTEPQQPALLAREAVASTALDGETFVVGIPAQPDEAWRVGQHYDIHVYAGDRPVATFHRAADAAAAVRDHNATQPDCDTGEG